MSALRHRFGTRPLIGFGLVAGFLLLNLFFYLGWGKKLSGDDGRTIHAQFQTAGQLHPGDNVRIEGKVEGTVKKVSAIPGGKGSDVEMKISKAAGPIYADAKARARWRTLLGGSFSIAIDRGTPAAGELGDKVIPISHTFSQVELEDVTGIFRNGARQGLQTLPAELAKGLSDPKALKADADTLAKVAPNVTTGVHAVRGQITDQDLLDVMTGADSTVKALDAPNDQLRGLVEGAAATVQTTGNRDQDIESILAQGPVVTSTMKTQLARLDTTLKGADGLVVKLQKSASQVGPTLAALRPTLIDTSALLLHARPLVKALRPALMSLTSASKRGVPLIDALEPSLKRVDQTILPYLGRKDPGTGYTTTVMIGGTAAGFGGAASQEDQNGHFIRFPASIGTKSVHLPCNSSIIDPAATSVLACETLQDSLSAYLQYIPGSQGGGRAK